MWTKQDDYHYNLAEGMTKFPDTAFEDVMQLLAPYSPRLSYNFIDPANSLFQSHTLTPVVSATNPIKVVIDQTQGGLGNLGPELKSDGVVGLVGTATAANYNTTTGDGTVTRVDVSNQSFVSFSGLANGQYRIEITNTGATIIRVISGTQTGTVISSISSGQSATFIGAPAATRITIAAQTAGGTGSFTLISFKQIPGNHATSSSDAKRPLFDSYTLNGQSRFGAKFDGGIACLRVLGFNLSNTNKVTVIAGVRKLSDAAQGIIVEQTATAFSSNGGFFLRQPNVSGTPSYSWAARGTIHSNVSTPSSFAAPETAFFACTADIAAPLLNIRRNGASVATSSSTMGTGNFVNSTLNIGGRNNSATLQFDGYLHCLFICGAIVPDSVLTQAYNLLGYEIGLMTPDPEGPGAGYIPASQTNPGFDVLGNVLTNPPVVGHNGAESEINFSPVADSWPDTLSIPGADLPNYAFDGDPGDIEVRSNLPTQEAKFILEKQ